MMNLTPDSSDKYINSKQLKKDAQEKTPDEVYIVLITSFLANMAYWQLLPFFPKFLREHDIDKEYLGYCMSVFALFFIFSSLFTGKCLLKYIERINGCFIGAIFVIINLLGLGLLENIDDKDTIIRLAFLFQIMGGIGNGINTPSTVAVLSSYKDKRETYIGYFEVSAGIGGMVGPMLGSALYYAGGY